MGNILTLTPALPITKPEMDKALAIIGDALSEIEFRKSSVRHPA